MEYPPSGGGNGCRLPAAGARVGPASCREEPWQVHGGPLVVGERRDAAVDRRLRALRTPEPVEGPRRDPAIDRLAAQCHQLGRHGLHREVDLILVTAHHCRETLGYGVGDHGSGLPCRRDSRQCPSTSARGTGGTARPWVARDGPWVGGGRELSAAPRRRRPPARSAPCGPGPSRSPARSRRTCGGASCPTLNKPCSPSSRHPD